ncbi:conserved hypothetical protein [Uncinocarpus reesii 1704]|uniref:Uncharacterized protein n=1 Tax=Uncinocarpus reesii (strain UAMH 1704) TaxID=336963 RepID=C4JP95_UNCRE|nr:uncharacterized protein UREG_04477 [Uncinocarpus reesii 1704]EEP79631.1 conserved hypothetical protein [Uncinocarpus reesii 1704]
MALRIAIVGAGLSGLASLKQCLEEGFNATIFESRDVIGGQWCYEEPDSVTGETASSIYEGVLLNSCRDTSSFSDFPMDPARYPDYFGHRGFFQYLEEYADHFGLKEHIRLNTKVISCSQNEDGKWAVKTVQQGGDPVEDCYDAVFACSGALARPVIPQFEGLETFKGKIFHSRVYRRPTGLEGKRVAIIGFGNSAADLSSEISWQAKELHLITRRGGWIVPRFVLGKPAETFDNHGLMEANVTMRSDLLDNIRTGRIIPHRAAIQSVSETSLILTDGTSIDVDVVIFCTGYHLSVPYVPEESYRMTYNEILSTNNSMDLYKLVASPLFSDLFFIGFVELAGPLIPVAEVQARWATSVLAGRIKLPPMEEVYDDIAVYQASLVSSMVNSDRHTVTIRYLPYCDDLLRDIGATPTFRRLFLNLFSSNPFRAARLLRTVYFGINSPAQYRLFGHGSKPNLASATLLRLADEDEGLSEEERYHLGMSDLESPEQVEESS